MWKYGLFDYASFVSAHVVVIIFKKWSRKLPMVNSKNPGPYV